VAELCAHIDAVRQPGLAEVLRAPVIRQWNGAVLGGLGASIRTSWQQRLLGISELTRRYPFKPGGDTHAGLPIALEWLDPKSGRLTQLYYQLAPDAAGGDGSPCGLRVKANLGPATAALLRRAKAASDLIFADLEQNKPVQRLTFTFDRVEFEEPDALQRYNVRITQVSLVLAGQRLAYIMDQPAPRTLLVPLPSAGPVNSYIEVAVVGDKRKADVRPARLERGGEWSPLALLRQAEMQPQAGDKARLTWRVPYGAGPPFIAVSVIADDKARRLIETSFEMEPTDSPDR
jgi:type VI protein secretion system component VasK